MADLADHWLCLQLTELEAEFDKLPSDRPVQTRFMRSQQDLKAKHESAAASAAEGAAGGDEEDGEETAAVEIDPLELIDPVEILSKLPKNFYEQIVRRQFVGIERHCSRQCVGIKRHCSRQFVGITKHCNRQFVGMKKHCSRQFVGIKRHCSRQFVGITKLCSRQFVGMKKHHSSGVRVFYCFLFTIAKRLRLLFLLPVVSMSLIV